DSAAGRAGRELLRHLDNRFDRAEAMLASLLGRRDQWLSRVAGPGAMDEDARRAWLEGSLQRQIVEELSGLRECVPESLFEELPALAAFAARTLEQTASDSAIVACAEMTGLPASGEAALAQWRGLAELLLTRSGDWRKRVTKAIGLPAGTREKAALEGVLAALADEASLRQRLHQARELPDWRYDAAQWHILGCLLTLLPTTAAELELVIRERGEADYVAVAHAARRALGDDDAPTDLALALDYRVRHVLLDEFQDTSSGQVQLLRRLTAGWEQHDGRTLFCVGDPMQSIYAFREAEVGLFLQVRREGRVNEVDIQDLVLEVNFRSDRGLVSWVNEALGSIMPALEDPRLGAVTFAPAQAWHGNGEQPPVEFHAFADDNEGVAEAARVVEVIASLRERDSAASIAVLVRARAHLAQIIARLRQAGMSYRAVEIEPLAQRPVIQDLMALTRAIVHPGDRTAWLAILRAPWCGLTLDEIEAVTRDDRQTVWQSITAAVSIGGLAAEASDRLDRFCQVMAAALDERGRRPLHRLVQGAWLGLGGPAALTRVSDLDDSDTYFRRLHGLQRAGDLDDVATLESRLDDLFAAPDPAATEAVQLMTVHKAKGLQFDYVLLPGLHRVASGGDAQLLHWLEFSRPDGGSDLLLATVEERGADRDPLHQFLKRLEARKSAFELERLLYVAVTRPRHQLHLFASLKVSEGEDGLEVRTPSRGSMLHLLWPGQQRHFIDALE
ncbi:MAG: 3'-5' exonuclease, partial [Gammaproteobacteria bacterium]